MIILLYAIIKRSTIVFDSAAFNQNVRLEIEEKLPTIWMLFFQNLHSSIYDTEEQLEDSWVGSDLWLAIK